MTGITLSRNFIKNQLKSFYKKKQQQKTNTQNSKNQYMSAHFPGHGRHGQFLFLIG
jgi:hypothetical protein